MSNKHPQKQIKHTVFYDGACGLCAKEIKYYKRIAPENTFNWVDVTRDLEIFESLGYTQEQGLKALHAQDDKGKMHIGVDAFILIWRHLKYWKILARIISLPILRQLLSFLYAHFANWRFKRLGYGTCKINQK